MGSIKWKVLYPYAVVIICGIITYVFWSKQNKEYKKGIINESKKEEDYEIIPSNAKPSRDYIDKELISQYNEEYIKTVLDELPPTVPPRVSSSYYETDRSADENILNDNEYLSVLFNYIPQRDDEIELKSGDRVTIKKKLDDEYVLIIIFINIYIYIYIFKKK